MSGYQRFRLLSLCLVALAMASWPARADKPARNASSPETKLLNSLWDAGKAAGNKDDWYRNCDNAHASIREAEYPQLNIHERGNGFILDLITPPRIIIGNASLGHHGAHGMTRFLGMTAPGAEALYKQYRNSQHYLYPAVNDIREGQRDPIFAMYPYVSQSVGRSGTEMDEVRKFIHTLAAFKPAVKEKLVNYDLLIPTLQMVWRRTRVATDYAYLTGEAHPSAFDNVTNNVDMIKMANEINLDNIPPMIQLKVVGETFGQPHPLRYNEPSRSEQRFTTPAAIARIHYGIEYTKRIVIDAGESYDVNKRPLTWHFAVLRGAPGSVRIKPLNRQGSVVEIEFDYQTERPIEGSDRPSSLAIVGAFVHNGVYYSAPGFITSFSLWNEERTYDEQKLLRETRYSGGHVNNEVNPVFSVSLPKSWDRDVYSYDLNGRLTGWMRQAGSKYAFFTADNMLVRERDGEGRPSSVSIIRYDLEGNKIAYKEIFPDGWQSRLSYQHLSHTTPVDTPLTVDTKAPTSDLSIFDVPLRGVLAVAPAKEGNGPFFFYAPHKGFSGIDTFSLVQLDENAQTGQVFRVRVAVGPADTVAPLPVSRVKVNGLAGDRVAVSWAPTFDNVEVLCYKVYRDDELIGRAWSETRFEDKVKPGATHKYSVTAVDDAGNESPRSPAVKGSPTTRWAQDNFADNNYDQVDPNLENGLRWKLLKGTAAVVAADGANFLRPGVSTDGESLILTEGSVGMPFLFEFRNSQAYAVGHQGAVLLYQNDRNYYTLVINSNNGEVASGLYRVMGGETTLIGAAPQIGLQHQKSSADYSVTVTREKGAIAFRVTRSNWSAAPEALETFTWRDSDPAALRLFHKGPVGFRQPLPDTNGVASYTNVGIALQQ